MKDTDLLKADPYALIEELSKHQPISPGALRDKLRVNFPSLQSQLRKLCARKLVTCGKAGAEIAVNRDFGYLAGIDMGASHLHFALADFTGQVINGIREKLRPEDGPQKTIAQIKKGVRKIVPRGKYGKLRALAIGVPSPVDPRNDLVLLANNLPGWTNVDLKKELQQEFPFPVTIRNDANMAALGEHWRGVAQGESNFIFIALGTGIGSGIFVNGELYVGARGGAGELHLLNVDWRCWREDFGDTGYFETYASGQGIAKLGRELIPQAQPRRGNLSQERDAFFVFREFKRDNPKAREVLEKTFTILGVGIANIVGVLDPEHRGARCKEDSAELSSHTAECARR
jgi:glucokinase